MNECLLCKFLSLITPSGDSLLHYFQKRRTYTLPGRFLPREAAARYYKQWMNSLFFFSFVFNAMLLSFKYQAINSLPAIVLCSVPSISGLSSAPKNLWAGIFRGKNRCKRVNEMSVKRGVPAVRECENKETQWLESFEKCCIPFLLPVFKLKI